VFNDGAFDWATDRETKLDQVIELEHGKPLIFGKKRDKGVRLNGLRLEVVPLGNGVAEDDLLFHDERLPESTLAFLLAQMRYPDLPEPIGVFRDVQRPIYEELMQRQLQDAETKQGPGDLQALFDAGDTWLVK
jgi:2-oxoglutarate ferredoxin oxidoreductase subunit beta